MEIKGKIFFVFIFWELGNDGVKCCYLGVCNLGKWGKGLGLVEKLS